MKSCTASIFRSRAATTAAATNVPMGCSALFSVSALRSFSSTSDNNNHIITTSHASTKKKEVATAAAAPAVKDALLTPKRELHRATHPLHLVRRVNTNAQQQHDFLQYAASQHLPLDLASYQHASAEKDGSEAAGSALPASKGGSPSGALRCSCCGHSTGRHPGHTDSGPQQHLAAHDFYQQAAHPQHHMVSKAGRTKPLKPGSVAYEEQIASLVGGRMIQSVQREQPPRGSGIQPLLDFNKQWAAEVEQLNPEYFIDLAKQQKPQYLWIGCSDSRVPANEIVGLYPGDIFVHRNIANVVCNSDLNALAVLQYAVQCLKVEHVIVTGHYNCGGVTAALNDTRIGLADHWILHVKAVKKRHWRRMAAEIPKRFHLDALCELNVLAQVESVVETHLIQEIWSEQNAEDSAALRANRKSTNKPEDEVEIHGWVYGLADGHVHPLLSLNRKSNVEKNLADATSALFARYSQMA